MIHRIEGQYFHSNGTAVHYTDEGSGPPVLLLHGFAVNADLNWRLPGIIRLLKRDFRVIAMDLRGHGLSGKSHDPSKYGLEMVQDAVRLLDHLNIDRARVVGYSLGGFIALKMACTVPGRVERLVVMGAGWERPGNSVFLQALPVLANALREGKGIRPLAAYLGPDRKKPGLLHTWWVKMMTAYFNDGRALAGVVQKVVDLTVREDELQKLTMPVCIIVGSEDPLRPGAEALAERVTGAQLIIIPEADHIQTIRRPDTRNALRRFLLAP
ncbi:MAG: alpha/beta hydrolase [candidate division KSB1 bacterium]|nr:alpha/beta hydrolase [candidate division KSB1 bacterium]MDQ7065086.1 alpha/beta hydrolase [candidate division KSB1 bacterium]